MDTFLHQFARWAAPWAAGCSRVDRGSVRPTGTSAAARTAGACAQVVGPIVSAGSLASGGRWPPGLCLPCLPRSESACHMPSAPGSLPARCAGGPSPRLRRTSGVRRLGGAVAFLAGRRRLCWPVRPWWQRSLCPALPNIGPCCLMAGWPRPAFWRTCALPAVSCFAPGRS